MASIRISQLAEVLTVTNDDVFVVNDGDINTRKITYSNLISGLVPKIGDTTLTGDLTISGSLTASDLSIASGFLTVDETNLRFGVGTSTPEQTLDINGNVQVRGGYAIRLSDPNNAFAITFQTPVLSANAGYSLPNALPVLSGQVLSSSAGGQMSWVSAATDPMAVVGDMIYRDVTNTTARLPIGGNGQVLTVQADGTAQWSNPSTGFNDPMTNAGDIIIRDAANLTVRLGIGTANQHLSVNSTGTALEWSTGDAGTTPNLNEVATEGASTGVNLSVGTLFTIQGDGTSQDGRLKLNCSQNSHGVTIQAPPHSAAASYTLTLPNDDGTTGQVLSTDGSGILDWINVASTAQGATADSAVQPADLNAYMPRDLSTLQELT
jgi:hypothetical protein